MADTQVIATQEITFDVASQSLVFDCEDGPITSVTSVTIYEASADDTAQAESATTGSASVDSVSTTTTAAAGASESNPKTIALTSATGVAVDRRYRISALGLSEDVDVVGISNLTVTVRSPLINDYASGATFKAMRATISLDPTWVADQTNLSALYDPNPRYRARWVVVVNGATQVYDRYFDLVRYPTRSSVTPQDVEDRFPNWLDALPVDERPTQGRQLIRRAHHALRMDLWGDGKADAAIRNPEVVAELVIVRAQLLRMEDALDSGAEIDPVRLDSIQKRYEQRYQQMIRAPFVATAPSGGGASSTPNRRTPAWSR